jgi:hypothetical protein
VKKATWLMALSKQLGKRTANWISARKLRKTKIGLSFDKPMVEETTKNILQWQLSSRKDYSSQKGDGHPYS